MIIIIVDFTFPVINGEKAAFNVPVFAQKRQRTLDMLIKNLYQDYMPENSKVTLLVTALR